MVKQKDVYKDQIKFPPVPTRNIHLAYVPNLAAGLRNTLEQPSLIEQMTAYPDGFHV